MTRPRVHLILAVAAAALLFSGCAAEPSPALTARPGTAGSTIVATPTIILPATEPVIDQSCVDGISRVSGSSQDVSFAGECERVEISGSDLEVNLRSATVREVIIRGDRNDVDAGAVSTLSIEGMDNEWDGASLGSISVRGDRNEIELDGDAGTVAVSGNDNSVQAAAFGAIDDAGERNRFDPR